MAPETAPDRVLFLGFGEPATRWLRDLVATASPGGPEFVVHDACTMVKGDLGPTLRALTGDSLVVLLIEDPLRSTAGNPQAPSAYRAVRRAVLQLTSPQVFIGFAPDVAAVPDLVIARISEFTGVTLTVPADPLERPEPTADAGEIDRLRPNLTRLKDWFGGHAARWSYVARALAEGDSRSHDEITAEWARSVDENPVEPDRSVAGGWVQSRRYSLLKRPQRLRRFATPRGVMLESRQEEQFQELRENLRDYARGLAPVFDEIETFCMFIGHPRSGSSLVGALLDAHPDMIISHELDVARYAQMGFGPRQIVMLIVQRSRIYAGDPDRSRGGYAYAVPGQWQGRFRNLRVLGDKQAGVTASLFAANPGLAGQVRDLLPGRKAYINIVRNPFDNITTDFLRLQAAERTASLDHSIDRYEAMTDSVLDIEDEAPAGSVLTVRHEDVIASPAEYLEQMCVFLGVEPLPDYLEAAASIVYRNPSRTRDKIDWPQIAQDRVHDFIARYPHLDGYGFDA